ncbi:MAG: 3-deoxy-7-phosphoheptulonate synthase [Sphingobacteriia bacterium]
MLVVMKADATDAQVQEVMAVLRSYHTQPEVLPGHSRVAIGVMGNKEAVRQDEVLRLPGVMEVIEVTKKYKRVSKEFHPADTLVRVGDATFGAGRPVVIAGPCSVESEAQTLATARAVKAQGGQIFRGGIFKPRTSPYFFQGIGYVGLQYMQKAREETGLPLCVEIMSSDDIDLYKDEVDLLQVGARNMQNFDLLKRLGKIDKPVLLKRGLSATVEEFLLAAEYILDGGNQQVILCERGVRTFETSTRNLLDLNSVALIKTLSHLPIVVDPSHAVGRHDLVAALARAAIAVGCDGLLVETHPTPQKALSDANQQLDFEEFANMMRQVNLLVDALPELYATRTTAYSA